MRNPKYQMEENAFLNNDFIRYTRGTAFNNLTDLQFDTFIYLCVRAKELENWTDVIEIEPNKYFEGMGRINRFSRLSEKQKNKLFDEIGELQNKSYIIFAPDEECPEEHQFDIRERLNYIHSSKYIPRKGVIEVVLEEKTQEFINKYDNNFTPIQLGYIVNLKSVYAKILYMYFRSFLSIHHSSYTVEHLKQMLGLINESKKIDKYKKWYDLKRYVLLPAIHEINTKTDIKVIGHLDKYNELLEENGYTEDEAILSKIAVDSMVGRWDKNNGSKEIKKIFFNVMLNK